MPEDIKNTGIIISYPEPTDFIAGGESGIIPKDVLPTSDWRPYKPKGISQFIWGLFESFFCVTFSAINMICAEVNRMLENGEIPVERVTLLQKWGFINQEGKFNASFAFTGKMSGTTKRGNTLKAVWESIRKDGLVPYEMWARKDAKNWEEYNAEIPVEVKNFAKNILTIFDFNYEWLIIGNCGVPNMTLIKNALKQCPLQLAAPACPRDANGNVPMCGNCETQHATVIFAVEDFYKQFDSYDPFEKNLAMNYTMPFMMKGIVTLKQPVVAPPPAPFGHQFTVQINLGEKSEEVRWLQKALIKLGFKTYATGLYAGITQKAVKEFQLKYQLASIEDINYINGRWVGPATRAKLNELLK